MRILVADDSPVVRAALSSLLADAGYEVVLAADGIEAIQRFYAEQPDLVLLDIQMPGMNGYVVCRVIKEDWAMAHIPVLILTAHDSAEDRYWSEKSGADGYLTKDALGDELILAIRSARASRALSELSRDEATPVALDESDVLGRVAELLDRKLFEMTIINDIITMATRAMNLRTTLEQVLSLLRRVVAYDIAGISLVDEKVIATRLDQPTARADVEQFRRLSAAHLAQLSGEPIGADELTVWPTEGAKLDDDAELDSGWRSFFAMALRSRGEVIGVLTVASAAPGVYTPQVARTLRLVEYPIAMVVDSAYHHQKLLEQEARMSLSALYQPPSSP